MILYHGSPNGKIERFGALQHFGNKEAALDRITDHLFRFKRCWVYRVHIHRNPEDRIVVIRDHNRGHHPWDVASMLQETGHFSEDDKDAVYRPKTTRGSKLCLLRLLEKRSIDLLRYRNNIEGGISWIVPDPARIKIVKKIEIPI
jgi:hypothetical protein